MKTDVKKLDKGQLEVTIELTPQEYQPFLETAAQKLSENMNVKGFRPGKATYELIEKHVGKEEVWQKALEPAIMKTLAKALDEEKIQSVGQPNVDIVKLAPDNPVIYKATVAILPEVTTPDISTITVEKKEVKADEQKLKDALENLQKAHASEKLVDREAKKGDKVEIDFEVFLDKVPVDNGAQKKFPLTLGEGSFIPGFEDKLIGAKAGEDKEFELEFPKEYHQKNLAGKKADFKVKVHGVYEVTLPELNDNLAKGLGDFKTIKEVEEMIKGNLETEAKMAEDHRIEDEMFEKLIEKSKFGDIPEILLQSETEKMLQELEQNLAQQGLKFDDYLQHLKKSREELMLDFTPQAMKRVKSALVMRAISQKENINVTDEEIENEIQASLVRYGGNPDAEKQMRTPQYKDYLRNVIASKKIIEHLKSKMVK